VRVQDVFFAESIRPCHAGGHYWDLEGVTVEAFSGSDGFNEQAGGWANTRWSARRKLRRAKRRMLQTALSDTTKEGTTDAT
jgi:hypothetical protein